MVIHATHERQTHNLVFESTHPLVSESQPGDRIEVWFFVGSGHELHTNNSMLVLECVEESSKVFDKMVEEEQPEIETPLIEKMPSENKQELVYVSDFGCNYHCNKDCTGAQLSKIKLAEAMD